MTFLKRHFISIAVTLVVAGGAAVDLYLEWVPPGQGRLVALFITAAVAAVIFALTELLLPRWRSGKGVIQRWLTPHRLPERLAAFTGREEALAALFRRHDQPSSQAARNGPLKILIHGMPGAGKSALAQEFAYQLADRYPHGQLYVKMGTVSERRDPGDILGIFLNHLGLGEDLPTSTEDRLKLFRSATVGKRVLIVLDGARDPDQVKDVLPSETRCTVIISSRRNLGPALDERSLWLEPPSPVDSARILRRYLSDDDNATEDVIAAVVDMCGCIPMAIRACCELGKRLSGGLGQVASQLGDRRTRLEYLAVPGRDIGARILMEYERLLPREQRALTMLALARTSTFVPWVLQPLLDTTPAEAASLLSSLSAAQFVSPSAPDPSGFARYRFNDLIRVFAEGRLEEKVPYEERRAAIVRLTRAMLTCCRRVLGVLDNVTQEDPDPALPSNWLPDAPGWEHRVAQEASSWVKMEFATLVDTVIDAYENGDADTCWRIVSLFGECVSPLVDETKVSTAFGLGLRAAGDATVSDAANSVKLAYGTHLAASGKYGDALKWLSEVKAQSGHGASALLSVAAYKEAGLALQRTGDYAMAEAELDAASRLSKENGQPQDAHLLEVLVASNKAMTTPDRWLDDLAAITLHSDDHLASPDIYTFVAFADSAMRRAAWNEALSLFNRAYDLAFVDEALAAYVGYKRSALLVRHALVEAKSGSPLPTEAIDHSACAVAAYRSISNPDGELRARAVLAEAYLIAGAPEKCLDQLDKAWGLARGLEDGFPDKHGRAACAELYRLEGEVRNRNTEYSLALGPFDRAIASFGNSRMFWDRARSQLGLGRTLRDLGLYTRALCVLYAALCSFESCGDDEFVERTLGEIYLTNSAAPLTLIPRPRSQDAKPTHRHGIRDRFAGRSRPASWSE